MVKKLIWLNDNPNTFHTFYSFGGTALMKLESSLKNNLPNIRDCFLLVYARCLIKGLPEVHDSILIIVREGKTFKCNIRTRALGILCSCTFVFFFRFLKHWEYFAKLVDTKGRDICEGSKSWSGKSLRKIGHMVFKMLPSTR